MLEALVFVLPRQQVTEIEPIFRSLVHRVTGILRLLRSLVSAIHDFAFGKGYWMAKNGAIKNVGMIFTVLSTYIYVGRQITYKRFIDQPAAKTFIKEFCIYTNDDRFKP